MLNVSLKLKQKDTVEKSRQDVSGIASTMEREATKNKGLAINSMLNVFLKLKQKDTVEKSRQDVAGIASTVECERQQKIL